jgi:xyloglucan-specific exo-beta-1,4-glucanase
MAYLARQIRWLWTVALLELATATFCVGATDNVAYTWQNVTVGGGGFSPAIIFSRAEPELAYLRTDIGGIYRWDHGGQTWLPLQDDFAEGSYLGIESIALDRHDPEVIYAAVGMYHSSPAALIRSSNRGRTWSIHPVPFRMGGNEAGRGVGERLTLDPNDAGILYFGSRFDGLQRSSDRGSSWEKVVSFPYAGEGVTTGGGTHTGLSFVVFDPRSGHPGSPTRTLFVGVADPDEHHVFRSDDAGATWSAMPAPPRQHLLPVQAQLNEHGMLYVTYSNSAGPNGATDGAVYKLDTETHLWIDITPDRSVASGYMGLSLDREEPDGVIVASLNRWSPGDALWHSTNGGRNWRNLRELSARDVTESPFLTWGDSHASFGWWMASVAIDPFDSSHVAYTTGATVYATRQLALADPMRTILWKPWVKGIEETAVITLTSPTAGPRLYSGFGDIGGYSHLDVAVSPPMFSHPAFDNTNTVDYAGANPRIVVRSGTPHAHGGDNSTSLAWSDDYGSTWQPIVAPSLRSAGGAQRPLRPGSIPITTSADGSVIVVMTPAPQLSRDHGKSWAALNLPPSARVVADRQNPRLLYALDFETATLWSSNDSGITFKPLASKGLPRTLSADVPGNPEVPVPLLAVPERSGDLWLISQGHLFHSLDGGRNFQAVSNDLSIARLSFGKAAASRDYPALYAIASRGELRAIWRSDDGGFAWARINDSKHEYGRRFRSIAGDMRIYGRVYVGTDGRGIVYGDSTD